MTLAICNEIIKTHIKNKVSSTIKILMGDININVGINIHTEKLVLLSMHKYITYILFLKDNNASTQTYNFETNKTPLGKHPW